MSTLRVNNILDSSGGDLVNSRGIAKAWVNFNGTGTVTIRAAHNVNSITDNGTGNYTVNFTNALADTNYALSGFSSGDGNSTAGAYIGFGPTGSFPIQKTTTSVRVVSVGSAAMDSSEISIVIHR